ncbi:MAG TPA: hypothetical protein VFE78_20820 [Gemmataceae bacterium]|nr:hypothetical protein [Gemmataceae bacterium]
MGNGEQSGSGGGSDWRVRLATGVGTVAGATVALFVIKPLVDIPGLWLGMLAFVAVLGSGALLGRLAGYLLFQRPPGK